jgi:hypothetical protein
MRWREVVGTVVAVGALAVGCASGMKDTTAQKTLYERLGGKPAIQAVVDDFVGNVAADTRINQRFAGPISRGSRPCSWTRSARRRAGRASTRAGA